MRGEETGDRPAFSRVTRKGRHRASIRMGGFKLIHEIDTESAPHRELYDLRNDPAERVNIAGRDGERAAELGVLLDAHLAQLETHGAVNFGIDAAKVPEQLREQLRALGYLD
jgi:arylsulfatase A-like enzyme